MRHTIDIYYNCVEYWLVYIQSRLFCYFRIKANPEGWLFFTRFRRSLNSYEAQIKMTAKENLTIRSEKKNFSLKKQVLASKMKNDALPYSLKRKQIFLKIFFFSLKQNSKKLLSLIHKACGNTFLKRYISKPCCHREN